MGYKKYVTVDYYKCPKCGYRVGVPANNEGKRSIIGNPEYITLYCNGCKEDTQHIHCGYRRVIK